MTIESIQDKAPGIGAPALACVQEGDGCVVKGMSCADCAVGPSGVERLRPILVKSRDPCGITLLRNFVGRLRPDDVRLRFAGPRRLESDAEIAGAFQCDCPDSEMIWALAADGALAGIASCALVGTSRLELSLIVRSDLNRRGIGFGLLEEVKARAQQRQISILCGLVLWENLPMRALARKSGFRATGTGGSLAEFELPLPVIGQPTADRERRSDRDGGFGPLSLTVQRASVPAHGLSGAADWRGGPQGDRSAEHLDRWIGSV